MNQKYLKGIKLALITALISGFANFINKFGVGLWNNAATFTTSKNIMAAFLLMGSLLFLRKFHELKTLSSKTWLKLILIGIIGGSIPFLLFFQSLTMIPVIEASFIHKTLFLWVALFSYPFLKERLSGLQVSALAVLILGVFMLGSPVGWSFGAGFLMALAATIFWAIENIIAKITLKNVSPITLGWARMFFGSAVLLFYLIVTGNVAGILPASTPQLIFTLMTGGLLFGYMVFWYSALKYAPATMVASVLVLATPITAILQSILVAHTFPQKIIFPLSLIVFGILFVSRLAQSSYSKYVLKRAH